MLGNWTLFPSIQKGKDGLPPKNHGHGCKKERKVEGKDD